MSIEDYVQLCWDLALKYIDDVLDEKIITNKWIKEAVKRHLDDVEREDLDFRSDMVDRVFQFCYFININIRNTYRRFIPLPFQAFSIVALFGLYWKGTNKRKYRYGFIFMSRKNGKSVFSAILQLYFLMGEGVEDPQSLLLASSREQASICLEYAKGIILNSPALNKRLENQRYLIKFKDPTKMGFCKTLASNANRLDGWSCSGGVLDEVHSYPNYDIFNVIKSSILARENPMILLISTAGFNLDSLCFDLVETGKNVLGGRVEDDSFFFLLYTLDDGDDYNDRETWYKSNPSLGETLDIEDLEIEFQQAKNLPFQMSNFLTKNLNIFVNQADQWIPDDILRKTFDPSIKIEDFLGHKCYMGIDLSSTRDLTSFVLVFERDGILYGFPYYFMANNPDLYDRKGGINLRLWIKDGFIYQCQTPTVDYDLIYNVIVSLKDKFIIEEIAYDRFNSALLIPRLMEYGFNCKEFQQTAMRFNDPIKFLEKSIFDGNIKFPDNPTLKWNIRNVVLYKDGNGNVKFMKNKSLDSIDGAVALAEGVGAYLSWNTWSWQKE